MLPFSFLFPVLPLDKEKIRVYTLNYERAAQSRSEYGEGTRSCFLLCVCQSAQGLACRDTALRRVTPANRLASNPVSLPGETLTNRSNLLPCFGTQVVMEPAHLTPNLPLPGT